MSRTFEDSSRRIDRSMKTIAFYSPKGGVGKTASAVNIAYLASRSGVSTLLWDLDSQVRPRGSTFFPTFMTMLEEKRGYRIPPASLSKGLTATVISQRCLMSVTGNLKSFGVHQITMSEDR